MVSLDLDKNGLDELTGLLEHSGNHLFTLDDKANNRSPPIFLAVYQSKSCDKAKHCKNQPFLCSIF